MNELTEGRSQPTVLLTDHSPRTTSSGYPLWTLLGVFVIAALLWICVAGRSGLWVDEVFSLAIATGHSLEHPTAAADPTQGDFVESDHTVPAEDFRRYLKHDNPPASPARVVRAVLLSDTSPPLYYLLLYGWTLVFGTSDIVLRLFSIACSLACLPLLVAIARRTGGKGAVFASCVLFVCSPLSIYYSTEGRMYSLFWLCVLATTWASLVLQQRGGGVGMYALWIVASAAGFLTHYFFVFPWLAIVAYLLIRPGKIARTHLVACLLLLAVLILPWYARVPESLASWRITKDWLKWQPRGFDRLAASRDLVLQFFSWRNKLWPDHRTTNIAALILFGFVAVAMVWRLRAQVFSQIIVLAWAPNVLSIYGSQSRNWQPIREVSHSVSAHSSSSDLILIHSIPSGVLGIARYADGPAELASWVGQLRTRRVPESIHKLAAGRTRVLFVRVHEVGEPAPEEDWLRANAVVSHEARLGSARIIDFRPLHTGTF